MTAYSPNGRSIFLDSRRFRLSFDIEAFFLSRVTERAAPLIRLEGPDISLSGRQILLKTPA